MIMYQKEKLHVITLNNMEPTDVLKFLLGRLIDHKNTCGLFSVN